MTNESIQVPLQQVKEVFLFLEELNSFLHDPQKYRNAEALVQFVEHGMYRKLHETYYHTVWNWLPKQTQREMEDRPSPFERQPTTPTIDWLADHSQRQPPSLHNTHLQQRHSLLARICGAEGLDRSQVLQISETRTRPKADGVYTSW